MKLNSEQLDDAERPALVRLQQKLCAEDAAAWERGDLPDWQELFRVVRSDRTVAEKVLHVADHHDLAGASIIARERTLRIWPGLGAPRTTTIPC